MKKNFQKFLLLLTVAVVTGFIFPTQAHAAPIEDDRTIFGETYTLESGRTLNGDLNVIGGIVNIKEDATVNGNVVVIGGLVTIDGTVTGDLTALGGTVNLEENALVQGDLVSPASYVNRDPGAVVQGDRIEGWTGPLRNFGIPERITRAPATPRFSVLQIANRIGRWIAFSLIMTGLGALLLLIMPKSTEIMVNALETQPWQMLGFGALTAVAMLFGSLVLAITICLIPIVILLGLTFALAVLVGWLTIGYELGKKISQSLFRRTWHPVLSAAVGNLLLYLIASGLDLIPCLGGFLVFLTMLIGLGTVVVTLFGTNPYPRGTNTQIKKQEILFGEKQSDWTNEPFDDQAPTTIEEEDLPGHPIDDLEIDERTKNILKNAGMKSVEQVLERLEIGDETLLTISGFGTQSLKNLKDALGRSGYQVPGINE